MATKNNSKQNLILKAAQTLFWKHGIKRVTIDEICKEAPASKMTFYKFFKNKEALAEYLLKGVLTGWHDQYREIMNQEIPFPDKIKQVIILKKESSNNISEEFIKDIYQNEESALKQQVEAYRIQFKQEIKSDFTKAQLQGWIRSDVKIDFILFIQDYLTKLIMDETLVAMYDSSQEFIMELTNFFFYGIINNDN